ncbi:MAG: 16S rRNA (guanine(527)-N(7))-methyltransferase RsmG [Paracoccaceae bacterium]|jgi:16S rRNA (guanine527-N7)-methyltransferase|nr:16S rRNA (guanine(527)-N(7))-methyltransferase RsmG [Paracoccaceae bacterium]MDP5345675.1 16S rRNA (guanine(527)-N(7))-methyltransferase RsmG [Paracoccaceae bacterium]
MTPASFFPNVSRETLVRLEEYAALLAKWNPVINLVSKSTLPDVWQRHMRDSAQLWPLCPKGARLWVDMGSGGGFPGIVIAILAAELAPEMRVILIESDQRKATFLRTVAQTLGLELRVESQRAEDVPPLGADVVSARALTALSGLLPLAQRHLAENGVAIFPKGQSAAQELTDALELWQFAVTKTPSETDHQAVVLQIRDIARA